MFKSSPQRLRERRELLLFVLPVTAIVAIIFGLLLQKTYYQTLNYTFVIATAFLHGHLGVTSAPSWLNELVPMGQWYYSVFPLGAVLSVLPISFLVSLGLFRSYPVDLVVVAITALNFAAAFELTRLRKSFTLPKRLLLATWLIFGTWYLTNTLFAGAWQIALAFAVLGQLGALYFSLIRPHPLLAGICLAIAVGNRTETALAAPAILAFLLRPHWRGRSKWRSYVAGGYNAAIWFTIIPALLLVLTAAYNYARFGSILDFGYSHIPGVLSEPWYQHGIFSIYAIPGNAYAMFIQGWHWKPQGLHLLPDGFGGSILLASPFLLLLLRRPKGDRLRWGSALGTTAALTLALWLHGNTGGWQFSYRYAMILLPWVLLLFIEWLPDRITKLELALWMVSVIINAYATYVFMWTTWLN